MQKDREGTGRRGADRAAAHGGDADRRRLPRADEQPDRRPADEAARARRPLRGRQEHAHAARGRGSGCGRAARAAGGPVGDRVRRGGRRSRRGREGARRRGPRHEDPRDPRRRAPGHADHGRGGREPREAAAGSTCCGPSSSARSCRRSRSSSALVSAPLQDLVGLIDARIEQLRGAGGQPERRRRSKPRPEPAAAEAPARPRRPPRAEAGARGGGSGRAGGSGDEPRAAAERRRPRPDGRRAEATTRQRDHRASTIDSRTEEEQTRWQQIPQKVLETLGSMTVLELVELKNKIEEEWGVTAAAPIAVAAAAPRRAAAAVPRRRGEGLRSTSC